MVKGLEHRTGFKSGNLGITSGVFVCLFPLVELSFHIKVTPYTKQTFTLFCLNLMPLSSQIKVFEEVLSI